MNLIHFGTGKEFKIRHSEARLKQPSHYSKLRLHFLKMAETIKDPDRKFMGRIVLALAAPAIIAAMVTVVARLGRRNMCPDFSRWMESEGLPIFVGIWLTFFIVFALVR
jgi:hypothetical protein